MSLRFAPPTRRPFGIFLALCLLLAAASAPAQEVAQDEAATRQYAAAIALQNREVYDLAADEWTKFLDGFPNDPRVDRATHYLGVCYLQSKQYDKALETLTRVVETYPKLDLIEATYLSLGLSQFYLGQADQPAMLKQAEATFAALATKFPRGKFLPQALYYRGEAAYQLKDRAGAVGHYRQFVQQFPKHELVPDVLYALGVAQEETGEHTAAAETYSAFLKNFSKNPLAAEVGMRRGEALLATGQFAEAQKLLAAAAAKEGFSLADHAALRLADCHFEQKQYGKAAAAYKSLVERFPRSRYVPAAQLAQGKCAFLAGDYPGARAGLAPLVEAGAAESAEAAHWIVRSHLKESHPAEGLRVAQANLAKAEGGAFAARLAVDLADCLFEIPQRGAEALDRYAEVAANCPADPLAPEALYMAAFAASRLERHDVALKHAADFQTRFAGNPFEADVWHVAAESNLLSGKHAEALTRYQQLLEKYPKFREAEACRVRIGLALYLQRKWAETIAALDPALARLTQPDAQAEARYLIGASHSELKQYPQATKALEASLSAQPKWRQAEEVLLALSHVYRQTDDLPKAKAAAERLLAEFPQSRWLDRAHYRLAELAYAASDFPAAVGEYRTVLDNWPQSPLAPHALYGLAWAEISRGEHSAARPSLDRLLSDHPQHELVPKARYARAVALYPLKEHRAAIDDLAEFLKASPHAAEAADARYLLGMCQAALDLPAEAVGTFRALLNDLPDYGGADKVHYELAWALRAAGQEADAVAQFSKLAKQFPESPLAAEALYHVGESQYAADEFSKSATSYYAAVQKAGKTELGEKATHKLGWAYYRQDQFDNAEKTFSAQRQSYPQGVLSSDAAFMQGECLFKLARYTEAIAAYAEVKETSNDSTNANPEFQPLALLHAGQAAAQLKRWDEALALLVRCSQEHPQSPYLAEALYEQGWARQNLGQLDAALTDYDAATKASNGEVAARARFMIGEIHFERKDHKEAVRNFFLVAFGYSAPVWQAAAHYEAGRCFEVLGNLPQAKKSYTEVVDKFPTSDKAPLAKERLAELGEATP